MKNILIIALLSLFTLVPAMAQKNVMVLENLGNKKSFKYYEGDKIEIKTSDSITLKGLISSIKDSVFVLDFYTEISVRKVIEVQRPRWAVNILSKVLMLGGAAMVILESVNSAVSSSGNMNMNYLYISAGAVGAGALMIPLQNSPHGIAADNWQLMILPMENRFNH